MDADFRFIGPKFGPGWWEFKTVGAADQRHSCASTLQFFSLVEIAAYAVNSALIARPRWRHSVIQKMPWTGAIFLLTSIEVCDERMDP